MLDADALPVVLATIGVVIVVLLFRRNSREAERRYPPSLPSLPIVGSLPFMLGGMDVLPEFFTKTAERLGPVFSFYTGSRLAVILNGKESITDAMIRHGEVFADKPGLWTEAHLLNKGLRGLAFTHYNELFKKYHKLTLIILKELGFGADKVTEERILQQATSLVEEFRLFKGRSFNPKPLVVHAVSNVIIGILFGRRFLSTGNGCRLLIDTASECVENMDPAIDMAPLIRFLPKYRKKISAMSRCNNGMLKGIHEGVELNKLPDAELSYVRRFLEDQGPGYDHQDLLYILRDMCLGGSDTVLAVILWGFTELANNREVQRRVQGEIDRVVGDGRYPTLEDKAQLSYTEAFILELLRWHTVSAVAIPHATLRDTTTSGYFIPGGSMVMINIYGAHMDPKIWSDPKTFRPERFLDEDNKIIGRDRILAFGVGRRSCIAENLARQEIFLLITSLVQRFQFLPPEGQDSIEVKDVRGLTIPPSHFEVRLIPRSEDTFPE